MDPVSENLGHSSGPPARTLHLVVPVYGGIDACGRFLPALCRVLSDSGRPFRVVVVDDGNGPAIRDQLTHFVAPLAAAADISLLSLPLNLGKGAAVYAGWAGARAGDALAFVDADGSVPAAEVTRLAGLFERRGHRGSALIGVRKPDAGRALNRYRHRSLLSRALASGVRLLTRIQVSDTQCGCKFVAQEDFLAVRARLREARFSFDIDLLAQLAASGVAVVEEPIDWAESGCSSVVLWRDIPDIGFGLVRVALRLRRARRAKAGG